MPVIDENQITIGILARAANQGRHEEAKGARLLPSPGFD
jgi:hypothetical protein